MLTARAIALQGVGYPEAVMVLQGFVAEATATPPTPAATPFLVDVSVGQGLDWKRKKRKKQAFLLLG